MKSRNLTQSLFRALILLGLCLCFNLRASDSGRQMKPDEALRSLKEGNERFTAGKPEHPHQDAVRRAQVARGQDPFATVITCSDSRVPVEMLFDRGLGDIFVIRVAGNVCDTDEVGSIEYGVDHLGTPLLVVLGHSSCGAVTAVVEEAEVHGSILPLVDNIQPAVDRIKAHHPELKGAERIAACVKANVWQSIEDLLARSPAASGLVKAGRLRIEGAVYGLESGQVEWLGPHPAEARLVSTSSHADSHAAH